MKQILLLPIFITLSIVSFAQDFTVEGSIFPEFYESAQTEFYDLNLDGKKDILTNGFDGNIIFHENQYCETYAEGVVFVSGMVGFQEFAIADMNGDDIPDIITSSYEEVRWQLNNGDGTPGASTMISSAPGISHRHLSVDDYDLDGDMDVIVYRDGFYFYENTGSGTFLTEVVITTDYGAIYGFDTGDMDGDGDTDIMFTNNEALIYLQNMGEGAFDTPVDLIAYPMGVPYPTAIKIADMDGDDSLDFVLGNPFGGTKVTWHKNLIGDSFGPEQLISTGIMDGYFQGALAVGDVNEDDYPDVFWRGLADEIYYRINEAGVTFSEELVITAGDGVFPSDFVESISLVDYDGDADLDLIYNYEDNWNVYLIKNGINEPFALKGRVFSDHNENGVFDAGDVSADYFPITLDGGYALSYTDTAGYYYFNFCDGILEDTSFLVFPLDLDIWTVTTDSLTYTAMVGEGIPAVDNLDFGITTDTLVDQINANLTGGIPRCGTVVNYWVDIANIGTTYPSGVITLDLDPNISYSAASPLPDSIVGHKIYWGYDSLAWFENELINVEVLMPDFAAAGDTLKSYLAGTVDSLDITVYSDTTCLEQIVICAYDPNDKKASAELMDTLGNIDISTTEIEYTIRFQNTGTDTAFNIIIRDQLDESLDWSSLTFLSASHEMELNINAAGEVEFVFDNIMLPDSNVNELESHGFVKYKINLNEGLAVGTSIENTAEIYFDANPAIITNTTTNTIVCYETPEVSMWAESGITTFCDFEGPGLLIGEPSGGTFSGVGIVGDEFDPNLAGEGAYMLYYTYEDEHGCTGTDSLFVIVTVCGGINDLDQNNVSIQPNPFSSTTTVLFDSELNGTCSVVLHNALGREVRRIESVSGNTLELEKGNLVEGVYFMTIIQNQEILLITKLIVQ